MSGSVYVGVDVGGTFTDVISYDASSGRTSVFKVPTSRAPADSVVETIARLGAAPLNMVAHATTIATNALLTRAGLAKAALVTNEGFRDVLEIARQRRPELYDLKTARPVPLVPRRWRFTVPCRVGVTGRVMEMLDEARARRVSRSIADGGFEAVAVCFLNAYANPVHETRLRELLREAGFTGPVSLSSEVDPEYREYERTSTTVVNAALSRVVPEYLSSLRASLDAKGVSAPVYVMCSDGSMSTLAYVSRRPASAIESGPAAGVLAARHLAREGSLGEVLTFDMGGTTAKAGMVAGGEPDVTYEFEAAGRTHSGRSIGGSGYVVRGPFIDLAEVSSGGGTIAGVDEGGALTVGPMSTGSDPGPACYGRGGTLPTVTDANVILGRLNPAYLLGGAMRVRSDLARRAFGPLARNLGVTAEEAAKGVVRLANNTMARAMGMVSVERGRDPRDYTMVAFGGAGPVHCCDLAEELGVERIAVPVHAGIFSAYGLLVSDMARNFITPVPVDHASDLSHLPGLFSRLEAEARTSLGAEGFSRLDFVLSVDLRYRGQSHELTVPFRRRGLRAAFEREHAARYGYRSPGEAVEAVNAKLRAVVRRPRASPRPDGGGTSTGKASKRRAWLGGDSREVTVHSRDSLALGERGRGPCIMEEYDSTLVVNPGWTWTVEADFTRVER